MHMEFDELFGEIKPINEFSVAPFTIIYGEIGSGKTVLATTCSKLGKTVLVNFENRISHIEENENLRIIPTSQSEFREDKRCSYDQFLNFISYVAENKIKVSYMIIDTLDEMFTEFLNGMLRKGEISDKYYGRAEVYRRMWEVLKQVKDLGIKIISPAHQKREGGLTDLLITDKIKGKVNQTVDNVFYLKATENNERVLLIKPTLGYLIKLTTKPELFENIQVEIQNPTWEKIIEVVGNA